MQYNLNLLTHPDYPIPTSRPSRDLEQQPSKKATIFNGTSPWTIEMYLLLALVRFKSQIVKGHFSRGL
jgi:hypothetical protein